MGPLDTAQRFYSMGVATIPVRFKEKTPSLGSWRPYQQQLPTPDDLLTWFKTPHNVGVITGWHGLTVLDFDAHTVYTRWLLWARKQGQFATAAKVSRTAYRVATSRGVHVYVWLTTPERNRKLPGIDVKARNGYVLGEGSIHPTGALYLALLPNMVIPHVQVLSDILPAALLLASDQPEQVNVPLVTHVMTGNADPWTVANQPGTITTGLVERIKKQLRIEDMFTDLHATSPDGRWQLTRCPLHDDNSPSMWVDTRDQMCGCFAGCTTKPLDVIDLYARMYGLNNREAIFTLGRAV